MLKREFTDSAQQEAPNQIHCQRTRWK